MLFNSIEFAIFLPLVFVVYWLLSKQALRIQNLFILVVSYVFYGWWDWRFLGLIFASSLLDFVLANAMSSENNPRKRKRLLYLSLLFNLSLLGFFKYFNFFIDNFIQAFTFFGAQLEPTSLNIILPVGISFYTFQTLSYSIDVYRRNLEPTKDIVAFFAFVSFFPQLVAGPIERASNLLPQFYKKRTFDYNRAVDGLRQILWGLLKKMLIADNAAIIANDIFNNSADYSGFTLLLGAVFFAFQIYGDFSGYSDIAIGVSRLFGLDLKKNFAFPYFSRDIAEFWRRWHISLSTWFRDYLYIPLGGSQVSLSKKIRNTFVIFLVSGFWHGANWTFVVWGGLNALYFMPLLLRNKNRNNMQVVALDRLYASPKEILQIASTFLLTVLAWVYFRADTIGQANAYIYNLGAGILSNPKEILYFWRPYVWEIFMLMSFVAVEWLGRNNEYALEKLGITWPRPLRWAFYLVLVLIIYNFKGAQQEFIYFDF
jgi:alginate O-acetyltransferase complex protein AlgI